MKKPFLFITYSLCSIYSFAQEEAIDSARLLEEVIVRTFEQNKDLNSTVVGVRFLEPNHLERDNKISLLSGLNTVPGVRMEERSPGSYRLNIRGSSLRSPFGVRNVKIYWNDIPITDPGGNVYFNQFARNNISLIEIFKGPAGSMYGAGTGGLIILNSLYRWQPGLKLEYITGSFGLHNIFSSAGFGKNNNRNQINLAHNEFEGYRQHTKMRRNNFSWVSRVKISGRQELTASLLFTDMYYQTPGALTFTEYNNNPRAARPVGGGFPSAIDAKAAIFQKNLTAGFTNVFDITTTFKNLTTLYGAFSQIKNPAIRNYERRSEPHFGGRTIFKWSKRNEMLKWTLLGGSEIQLGYFNTRVSKNRNGNPDTVITNDDIRYNNYNIFIQADAELQAGWIFNGGVSLNKTEVEFTRLSQYPVINQQRTYRNELAPRISLRKNLGSKVYLKGSISRGFSPPSIAELLPSTGMISTDLEAEYGWNYELITGIRLLKNKLLIEGTGFYFRLNNTLVQRRDSSGADFFVNAGNTQQAGIEIHSNYYQTVLSRVFDHFLLQADFSYNHLRYGVFIKGTEDFTGKKIPSVPGHTLSILLDLHLKKGFFSNATYYTSSSIFLNDANTVSAPGYHLLGWKLGWEITFSLTYKLNFYAGVDNLLDQTYSLGNDINAAAGRYYNAAPRRNYYAGLALQWLKPQNK